MAIETGARLGHYEIVEAIGSGGMGDVYRARDTKLHREVAIKVLSEKLDPLPERLARFEREAHLLASLNHPNIASIHGLEKDQGIDFLVLELVEGETLAERIARGPIPLAQALSLFEQIAHGLEAAHDKGIIHRDLKPPNIKITPEGHVKILDFGLGKVFEEPEAGRVDLSQSPTLTREGTRAGVILGTAAYMSPEQARSEPVDKRTDIWAFGVCLYEALTGKPAFTGKSVVDILASVVRVEPDWERLPAETPFLLRRVLQRCLEKNVRRRLHDIADARMDLEDAPSAAAAVEAGTKPGLSRLPYLALLGIAIFGLGVLVSSMREPPTPELPVTRFEFETDRLNAGTWAVAFSRDGTKLAHAVRGANGPGIDLRHLDRDRTLPIPGTEPGKLPVFSPDGEWVAFVQSDKLKKVPVDGGDAVTLCDYKWASSFGIDWETNDRIYFADRDGLYVVPASGGERELLEVSEAESDRVLVSPRRPDVLPGGNAVLLTVGGFPQGEATALQDVKTGRRWVVLEDAVAARYAPSGHIVFLRDDTLHAVRFDLDNLAVEGEPVPVLENIEISLTNGNVQYAFSDTGSLAYIPGAWEGFRRKLVWVDFEGNVEPIRSLPRRIAGPQISPDGESIALAIFDGTRPGVWLTDASRETLTPLSPGQWAYAPSWSPDGERLASIGMSAGARSVFLQSVQSSAKPELVGHGAHVASWAPNENLLAYMAVDMRGFYDIWTASLAGDGTPKPLLAGPYMEGTPDFSPDGRWIAYVSTESGDRQIYVQPFGREGGKHQISTDGGMEPLWSPDGREIYYRADRGMMAVEFQTEPFFNASSPRVLFEDDYLWHDNNGGWVRNYDLSPDGKRFLMIQSEEEPPPPTKIKIVLNWFEELKRLVPVDN